MTTLEQLEAERDALVAQRDGLREAGLVSEAEASVREQIAALQAEVAVLREAAKG